MKFKSGGAPLICVGALSAALFLFFSCASTPEKVEVNDFTTENVPGVSIPLPPSSTRAYFASINQDALSQAENGSPESLKITASILHRTMAEDYTEQEKVLLYVCAEVMRIVWPQENVSWEVPDADTLNPYAGAIASSRKGIYDSSTGNTDFLTMVLPSLVLLTSTSKSDYYDEAFAALKSALALKGDSVLANYLMGHLQLRMGNPESALSYFTKSLNGSRNNFQILASIARAQLVSGQYSAAYQQAETLLVKNPQNTTLLQICAEACFNLGQLDLAEDYVLRVLQLQPENLNYVLFRARILIEKGDYIRASSLLDVYSRSDQSSRTYLLLRARMQRDWNKNNNAASETIARAVNLYPENIEVLLFAAEIASSSNLTVAGKTALELAQTVLGYDAENVKALDICIAEMIKLNDMTTAYALSTMLMEREDAGMSTKHNHAALCLALGYKDEAWKLAQEMYAKYPEDEEVVQTYIKVLVGTNRRSQASELISRLMPSASNKMKSFLYYERSFFGYDDEDVLSDLRSSLTANPRNRDALFRLYQIYYARNDWKRAQYYLKQVVALEPNNATILTLNAELEALLGR